MSKQQEQPKLVNIICKEVQFDWRGDCEWQFGVNFSDIDMTLWWDDLSMRKQWVAVHGTNYFAPAPKSAPPNLRVQTKQVYVDGQDYANLVEYAQELMQVQTRASALGVQIGGICHPRILEVKSTFDN